MECPECHFAGIHYRGLGTQRLEAEVKARFPEHRCLRMDTDTMQKHGSHEAALRLFHDGEVRILVGTQMIAKGLDFPNVTLVGVINADTALHIPDFRASERTFQLVTQVAGRTGRGDKGGRVLVQTFNPDHAAILAAVRHDYETFAAGELPPRREHGYPPFASLIRLVVRGPAERTAGGFAEELALRVRQVLESSSADAAEAEPRACWGRRRRRSRSFATTIGFISKCMGATARHCAARSAKLAAGSSRPTKCNGSPTSIRWTCSDLRTSYLGGSSVISCVICSLPRLTVTGTLSPALYLRSALSKSSRLPILLSPN